MTPDQQRQIEGCTMRAKMLRLSGIKGALLRVELRREGWPEAAVIVVMKEMEKKDG